MNSSELLVEASGHPLSGDGKQNVGEKLARTRVAVWSGSQETVWAVLMLWANRIDKLHAIES